MRCAQLNPHSATLIALLICLAICLGGCNGASAPPTSHVVTISGEEFEVELAIDEAARERGLKHRESIPDQGGMLFVFPDDEVQVQSFWMHDCMVDMDIIFLDPRGFVTATHRMKREPPKLDFESEADYQARLRKYSSGYPAQFAIELKSGALDRLNIQVDHKIELDVARLKALTR